MNKQDSGYRWIVFSTVLLAFFVIITQRNAPGLITEQLMHEFHVSAAVIGLMSSFQFFAYSGFQIPVGLLSDKYGPNRFLIFGTFLAGIGCILYSFSPNEYILIGSRFLTGIGDSMIFINIVLILNQWFKGGEFLKLMGSIALIAGTASLTSTVPFSAWISLVGWRTPFLTVGIVLALFSFVLYIILVIKTKNRFTDHSTSTRNNTKKRESAWCILKQVATTRQAWSTFLCHFGVVGTYVGFIGSWGVPYGMNVFDMTRSQASQLTMYILIGAMVSGPIVGWVTSKVGSIKKVYLPMYILVVLGWIGIFFSGSTPSFSLVLCFFLLIGIGNGASNLTFSLVRESFPAEKVGVVSGFSNTGGFLSAVLLPILFGHVLDSFPKESIHIGYHYGFLIPLCFSIIGFIGLLLYQEKRIIK